MDVQRHLFLRRCFAYICCLLLCFITATTVYAQKVSVKGTVVDTGTARELTSKLPFSGVVEFGPDKERRKLEEALHKMTLVHPKFHTRIHRTRSADGIFRSPLTAVQKFS